MPGPLLRNILFQMKEEKKIYIYYICTYEFIL